jgi:hypothetical protein
MGLTDDRSDPRLGYGTGPGPRPDGMQEAYLVDKGEGEFVRPVRRAYKHIKCGTVTTMNQKIAETYARNPKFYGSTYCAHCRDHLLVGENGEFIWTDDGSKVGT